MEKDKREKYYLKLGKRAAKAVPAYREFLQQQGVTSAAQFSDLPVTSKKNYLSQHALPELVWNGKLAGQLFYTSTSGSTGQPTYFVRDSLIEDAYADLLAYFVRNSSYGHNQPTLVIIAFGMGVWIGGLFTFQAFSTLARRERLPISVITPGVNKEEIFKALRFLSPHYSQTILVGYPPFVKDVIDEAEGLGLPLASYHLRLLFAAEAFSDSFRQYVAEKGRIGNPYLDTLNIYGSADIGAMAFETPLSILLRELAGQNKHLFTSIFGEIDKTPTLAQYNPRQIHFEATDGELLVTGNSAMPLLRYAIGDHGGVFEFAELMQRCQEAGLDIPAALKERQLSGTMLEYPFVYVYERKDFSATLYGINIYPEYFKDILLGEELQAYVTEKFTLVTRFDSDQNQYLEINIELKKDVTPTPELEQLLWQQLHDKLRLKSSEFRELSNSLKDKILTKVVLWPYGDPTYFKGGVKQKWVIR